MADPLETRSRHSRTSRNLKAHHPRSSTIRRARLGTPSFEDRVQFALQNDVWVTKDALEAAVQGPLRHPSPNPSPTPNPNPKLLRRSPNPLRRRPKIPAKIKRVWPSRTLALSVDQVCTLRVRAPAVPPAGLAAWWRAENNAQDAVGTNHGTLANGATFAAGKVGQAFSFDGVDDKVSIPEAAATDLSRMAGWTIETWVRPTSFTLQTRPTIYSEGRWAASLGLNSGTGKLESAINNANILVGTVALQLNAWNHVALTSDGTTRTFYVNGAFAGSGTSPAIVADNAGGSIGDVTSTPSSSRFPGQIDEVSLYSRVLSGAEIASLYDAGAAGKSISGPYITTLPSLAIAALDQTYSHTFASIRGTAPVTYALTGGALPWGLTLSSAGVLTGVPMVAGTFSFNVRATDASSFTGDQLATLTVLAPLAPPDGMVACWRAENNAQDAFGANDGTLSNGATFAAGKVRQGFLLDGVNDSIDIPDAAALRPASLTLEAWVLFNSTSGIRLIMAKPLGAGTANSFALWSDTGTLTAKIERIGTAAVLLTKAFAPVLGRWYHVAYTFDDITKQQALYLDGAQVAAGTVNISIGYDSQPVLLGRDTQSGVPSFFFSGRIDEAAIYNRALGAGEIASVYNSGPAGKTPAGPYITTLQPLADAFAGQSYTQTFASIRGTAPVTFSVSGGSLPPGLTLSAAGVLSGVPTNAGTYSFTVRATDAAALFSEKVYTLGIFAPIFPYDGQVAWWRAENNAQDALGTNHEP